MSLEGFMVYRRGLLNIRKGKWNATVQEVFALTVCSLGSEASTEQ